jgi:hypothetical protein
MPVDAIDVAAQIGERFELLRLVHRVFFGLAAEDVY